MVSKCIVEQFDGDRVGAARQAAVLAQTSHGCADLARSLHDRIVDPGCLAPQMAAERDHHVMRVHAAAELKLIEAMPPPHPIPSIDTFDTWSVQKLRDAIRSVPQLPSPRTMDGETRKIRKSRSSKAMLCQELLSALSYRDERVAALREFLAQPELRYSTCPVRSHARAVVIALATPETIKRSLAWRRYRVSAAELATIPRKPHRHYSLADVLAIVERKALNRASGTKNNTQPNDDPLAEWEKARKSDLAERIRVAVTAARASRRVAHMERLHGMAKIYAAIPHAPPWLALAAQEWLCGKPPRTRPKAAADAGSLTGDGLIAEVIACHDRAHELRSAMNALHVGTLDDPDSRSIWCQFVHREEEGMHAAAADVAARIAEMRFLHVNTPYPSISRAAAMEAWSTQPHVPRDADGHVRTDAIPPALRTLVKLVEVWPPPPLSRLIARDRWEALMTNVNIEHLDLLHFRARAIRLDTAIRQLYAWIHNVGYGERDTRTVERAIASALCDEGSVLTASKDQVIDIAEASMGRYRCPLCPPDALGRFTEVGMDTHIRAVHEEA